MKRLLKHASLLSLFICLFFTFPLQVFGEGTTNSDGKMRFKMERIGGKEGVQSHKETELEKIAPDLFKEETKETIEKKQSEIKNEVEHLEEILFTTTKVTDSSMQETKKILFSNDYETPKSIAAEDDGNKEGTTSNVILYSAIGVVVLLCGGIFTYMQKVVG